MTICFLGGVRTIARRLREKNWLGRFYGPKAVRVLIAADYDEGESVLRAIRRSEGGEANYRIVGLVVQDSDLLGTLIGGVPVLGTPDQVRALVDRHRVDQVFVIQGELTGQQMRSWSRTLWPTTTIRTWCPTWRPRPGPRVAELRTVDPRHGDGPTAAGGHRRPVASRPGRTESGERAEMDRESGLDGHGQFREHRLGDLPATAEVLARENRPRRPLGKRPVLPGTGTAGIGRPGRDRGLHCRRAGQDADAGPARTAQAQRDFPRRGLQARPAHGEASGRGRQEHHYRHAAPGRRRPWNTASTPS